MNGVLHGVKSRRWLLKAGSVAGLTVPAVAALAGCGEKEIVEVVKEVPVEKVVTQQVEKVIVQEKVVTQIVEKVVTAEAAKPKQVAGEIVQWTWWSLTSTEAEAKWTEYYPKEFQKRNPETTVKVVSVPWGEISQKFMAAAGAGDPPTVIHTSTSWARDWYDLKALSDLDEYIVTDSEMADDKFMEHTLIYRTKKGKHFGIPWEGPDSRIFVYNKDMFLEAGIDPSYEAVYAWKWDDFGEAAGKLTVKEGTEIKRAGYLVPVMYSELLTNYLHSQGHGFYNEDQTATDLLDGFAEKAINFELGLLKEVSLPLAPERQDRQQFIQGNCAMMPAGTWNIKTFREGNPDLKWDMLPYPDGGVGHPAATTWTNMMTIPAASKNKDAAWRFIQFFCGQEMALERLKVLSKTGARNELYITPEWKQLVAQEPLLDRIPRAAEVGGDEAFIRQNELNSIFDPLMQAIYVDGAPVRETLEKAAKDIDAILAKAGGI